MCAEWLGAGLQIRSMQVRVLSPTPSLEIWKCGRARFNAPDLKSDGCSNMFREFESHHFHQSCLVSLMVELRFYTADTAVRFCHEVPNNAKIAQLVEHRIENPGVGGSIPSLGTS